MKTMHALLVDDDKQALETMGMILEMDNFLVSTAASGQQALGRLERAEESPPHVDFLIMDLDMDNLSGIELLTELGKRGHWLPVMVVTGFASKGMVVELLRHGVCDFLDKPIHLEEFRIRVHRIANEVLRRRKTWNTAPTVHSDASFRTATYLDLGNLGIPFVLRRLINPADPGNLVLAGRKPTGYVILLASVSGTDAESFFISSLIKTFFDKCRDRELDGRDFLRQLNKVILEGALGTWEVRALYIRILRSERRLEILPSGFPARIFFGLGETNPHMMSFSGSSLGIDQEQEPGRTLCEIPFERGNRIFIQAGMGSSESSGTGGHDNPGTRTEEAMMALGFGPMEEMTENAWRVTRQGIDEGEERDALLLGIELP